MSISEYQNKHQKHKPFKRCLIRIHPETESFWPITSLLSESIEQSSTEIKWIN